MKSLKLNSFKGYQLPAQSEILILGGISCHDAGLIIDAHCHDDNTTEHCQRLCSMDLQCTGSGGPSTCLAAGEVGF